jgi:hypothetical protein
MAMLKGNDNNSRAGVAFEASVLAQQKFDSIAIPFAGSAKLDWYLKLWNKRVLDNDVCQWAWWIARARVENNREQLAESDLETILRDADHAREALSNPALLRWFNATDAGWFDSVRGNIEELANETVKSLAIMAGIFTGDYLLSFDRETAFLRRPLSEIYLEMLKIVNRIIDNQAENRSTNFEAIEFIMRARADLLYARLPAPGSMLRFLESQRCWREAWVRGSGDIHSLLFPAIKNSLSGVVSSKERYLQILGEMLERAKHLPLWAISFQDDQPATLNEISEIIKKYRPVQASYLKDTSDIVGGAKCYIVIAAKKFN